MKSVYRVFALLIAAGVALQAAAIAFAMFGLTKWIDEGGTLDKAAMEGAQNGTAPIAGGVGFATHGIFGTMILPAIAILFLIISFFAKVPGGTKWAAIIFFVTVLQVALGIFSHELAGLGWLHGLNALILFGLAVSAAMRLRTFDSPRVAEPARAL